MTDQEWMAHVDSHLARVWDTHRELVRLFIVEVNAYEAIISALEKSDQGRIPGLRRAFDAAHKKTSACYGRHFKNLKLAGKAVMGWKSPGREFVRFRDQTQSLVEHYGRTASEMRDEHEHMRNHLNEVCG